MRRILWTAVALLALAYTLLPSIPALAEYGAIAWDRGTGKYGQSWNQPTKKGAEEAALGECGTSGCQIIARIGPRMCGALAVSPGCVLACLSKSACDTSSPGASSIDFTL